MVVIRRVGFVVDISAKKAKAGDGLVLLGEGFVTA
jgi:hypothetical protein